MLTVKLYEYSGTYIKDIDADSIKIKRSRGQEIRSTASFSAPAEFLQDLKKADHELGSIYLFRNGCPLVVGHRCGTRIRTKT